MATFTVKIDGKERVVELDEGHVRVDGAELALSVESGGPGIWVLRDGIEQTIAQVDGNAPKLTVELRRPGGDPILLNAEVTQKARADDQAGALEGFLGPPATTPLGKAQLRQRGDTTAAAEGTGPVTLRSPIPGRVAKLLAKPGDKVAAGQTLIVLEAMKMENELRAPRAGTLSELRCAEGAPVEAGQDLATIV